MWYPFEGREKCRVFALKVEKKHWKFTKQKVLKKTLKKSEKCFAKTFDKPTTQCYNKFRRSGRGERGHGV
jgi:hypothetical protein